MVVVEVIGSNQLLQLVEEEVVAFHLMKFHSQLVYR
jgi:hypothetical protein